MRVSVVARYIFTSTVSLDRRKKNFPRMDLRFLLIIMMIEGAMSRHFMSIYRYQFPCFGQICTFPDQFCHEKSCLPCSRSLCEDGEKVPLTCEFMCNLYAEEKKAARNEARKASRMKPPAGPVECGVDSIVVVASNGTVIDSCRECPAGTKRLTTTTSYREDRSTCYDYEKDDCPYSDTVPADSPYSRTCPYKCRCDVNKCFYGDPCVCDGPIPEPCDPGYELNSTTGECVPCELGYVKPEKGCHACVNIKEVYRYMYKTKRAANKLRRIQKLSTDLSTIDRMWMDITVPK